MQLSFKFTSCSYTIYSLNDNKHFCIKYKPGQSVQYIHRNAGSKYYWGVYEKSNVFYANSYRNMVRKLKNLVKNIRLVKKHKSAFISITTFKEETSNDAD